MLGSERKHHAHQKALSSPASAENLDSWVSLFGGSPLLLEGSLILRHTQGKKVEPRAGTPTAWKVQLELTT